MPIDMSETHFARFSDATPLSIELVSFEPVIETPNQRLQMVEFKRFPSQAALISGRTMKQLAWVAPWEVIESLRQPTAYGFTNNGTKQLETPPSVQCLGIALPPFSVDRTGTASFMEILVTRYVARELIPNVSDLILKTHGREVQNAFEFSCHAFLIAQLVDSIQRDDFVRLTARFTQNALQAEVPETIWRPFLHHFDRENLSGSEADVDLDKRKLQEFVTEALHHFGR